jgi:hypothetical protein
LGPLSPQELKLMEKGMIYVKGILPEAAPSK